MCVPILQCFPLSSCHNIFTLKEIRRIRSGTVISMRRTGDHFLPPSQPYFIGVQSLTEVSRTIRYLEAENPLISL